MTIILILAVALVAGVIIQSQWVLLLPLGIGACCVSYCCNRTWPWRHSNPVPGRRVHACDGRRSRLAVTGNFADLVKQIGAAVVSHSD